MENSHSSPDSDLDATPKNSGVIKSILVEQEEKNRTAFDPLIVISGALNQLKDRDRDVLVGRYGIDTSVTQTLEGVGQKLGVTRERVRQIEAAAIKKLSAKPSKDLQALLKTINSFVSNNGGLVSLKGLVKYLKVEKDERRELESSALALIMDLNPEVKPLKKSKDLVRGWMKKDFNLELVAPVIKAATTVLGEAGKPLASEVLWSKLGELDPALQKRMNSLQFVGILSVAASFDIDKKGDWGLAAWPSVTPKRIRDKVFLVLETAGAPLHFKEITDQINQAYPAKQVLNRTVHNELIGDERFVLVGRGIYALTSWGYEPGVVADVIKQVLATAGKPLSVKEITQAVLVQREVKPNTIVANLQNKEKFTKAGKGLYTLA